MLAYDQVGSGFPVVFLHGFCERRTMWEGFVERMPHYYTAITVDLPGFGDSPSLPDSISIEYFAAEVYDLLAKLKVKRFVLVGHSLGGYVSLALIRQWPQAVVGLSMIHSTAYPDSEQKKENRMRSVGFVEKYGGRRYVKGMFEGLFSQKSWAECAEEFHSYIAEAATTSEDTIVKTLIAMRDRRDQSDLLSKINFPVQHIIGKEDQAVSLQDSLAQCHLAKDNWVLILEEIGHMGFLEAPRKTFSALSAFLEYCEEVSDG